MKQLLTLHEKRVLARKLAMENAEKQMSPATRKTLAISCVITAINVTVAIACYLIAF